MALTANSAAPTRRNRIKVEMGPEVDESSMLSFEKAEFYTSDVVTFTHYGNIGSSNSNLGQKLTAPLPQFDMSFSRLLTTEPSCDINAKSVRFKLVSHTQKRPAGIDFASAIGMHGVIVGVIIGSQFISDYAPSKVLEEPVEIAFGVEDPGAEKNKSEESPVKQDVEALKTAQQLPQLPKNIALDVPAPPAPDQMPLPEVPTPQPTLAPATPPPKLSETPPPKVATAKPIDAKTPPPGVKKMTIEELARRTERENRKVGEQETDGKVKGNEKKATAPADLPKNPFESHSNLPTAPAALGQGIAEGSFSASANKDYAASATGYMRRHWNLPDFAEYDQDIEVTLQFSINVFGKVVGKISVKKSSGNPQFDLEAKKAIEAASPFPDLPQELSPNVTMTMRFSPKEVKR